MQEKKVWGAGTAGYSRHMSLLLAGIWTVGKLTHLFRAHEPPQRISEILRERTL